MIRELIVAGATDEEIADDHFAKWCQYGRQFVLYRNLKVKHGIRLNLRVIVLWGKAGTGKTRYVYTRAPIVFSVPDPECKWFDGYAGEPEVLIDDYRGGAPASFILKLLDIYPLSVPVKGGFVPFLATTVYITSNIPPEQWHTQNREPLMRRIHHVVEFTGTLTAEQVDEKIGEVGERETQ